MPQQPCPHCRSLVIIAAPQLQAVACPICGGWIGPSHAPVETSPEADFSDADYADELQPGGGGLLGLLIAASVVIFLLCLTALGIVIWKRAASRDGEIVVVDGQKTVLARPSSGSSATWVDAALKTPIRLNDVMVSIEQVEYGQVRARDAGGSVIVSDDADYLQVFVAIKNRQRQSIEYSSWYGGPFTEPPDANVANADTGVSLVDDQGGEYPLMRLTGVASVRGHTPRAVLKPPVAADDPASIDDVVIFAVPDDAARREIQHFRLELPARAYGGRGSYRFDIPSDMIEGF